MHASIRREVSPNWPKIDRSPSFQSPPREWSLMESYYFFFALALDRVIKAWNYWNFRNILCWSRKKEIIMQTRACWLKLGQKLFGLCWLKLFQKIFSSPTLEMWKNGVQNSVWMVANVYGKDFVEFCSKRISIHIYYAVASLSLSFSFLREIFFSLSFVLFLSDKLH